MNSPDGKPVIGGVSNGDAQGDEFEWLFSLQRFGIKPGLETTEALLRAVDSPQSGLKVVLVAGTNGKGSVTTILATCLEAAGQRTGSYFSPHLQRIGERVRIDGVESTSDDLRRVLRRLRPHALRLEATFFEVITVAALLRFREAEVQWAVMEVGLGGRLDATNALDPALSVITTVGLDHTAVLGADIATIAAEKAGIMRPGVPVLTSADGVALEVIAQRAALLGAPLVALERGVGVELLALGWDGVELNIEVPAALPAAAVTGSPGRSGPVGSEPVAGDPSVLRLRSPLIGRHQSQNVALAALAALSAGVDREMVQRAVAGTRWPGRLEVIELHGRRFVLDGAHNPQAARALATAIRDLEAEVAVLVLGLSADKDAPGVLEQLAPLAKRLLATRAEHSPRAADPERLLELLRERQAADLKFPGFPESSGPPKSPESSESPQARAVTGPRAALAAALVSTSPGDVVVVAGSLFLVGEFRSLLSGEESEGVQRWQ